MKYNEFNNIDFDLDMTLISEQVSDQCILQMLELIN